MSMSKAIAGLLGEILAAETESTPANGGSFTGTTAPVARGVHGQTIHVDPTAEMVIGRSASHPRAQNGFIDPTSLSAYRVVAEYLPGR